MSSSPAKALQSGQTTEIQRNLYSTPWTNIQWNGADMLSSVEEIRKQVEHEAVKAIHWYYEKKRKKVWYSQCLRMLAVLFGSIGAGIPFLAATGILQGNAANPDLAILRINQWGYVFILGAGMCVAIDKLFGFSTNWIRFVDAATKIETLLGRFRLEWYKELALADVGGHPAEAAAKLFDVLLDFATKTRDIIERETGDWIVEFRSNLTKLAEDTKATQEAREKQMQSQVDQIKQIAREREQKSGSVTVSVTNFGSLGAGFVWSLELDNELRKANIDRGVFIIKALDPGTYLVSGRGTSNSILLQDSQTVLVESAKPSKVNLNLK